MTEWTIDVRPPWDDAWGLVSIPFEEEGCRQPDTLADAIEAIQAALDDPREVKLNDRPPVALDHIEIDAHPDYEGELQVEQLRDDGLGAFGVKPTSKFDGRRWHERQPEYRRWLDGLDGDEVLVATAGEPAEDHPEDWEWNRALWARPVDGDGYDLVLHRAEHFRWFEDRVAAPTIVQFLQGGWSVSPRTYFRYHKLELAKDPEEPLEFPQWKPDSVTVTDVEDTPLADEWDYCPKAPTAVNGWEYDAFAGEISNADVWRGPNDEKFVRVAHLHDAFSFIQVRDCRLGGARSAIAPDDIPSKGSSDYTPMQARQAAIEWMEDHDPDLWRHPGYHEALFEVPEGWERDYGPTVGTGQSVTVKWTRQADVDGVTLEDTITISGPAGQKGWEVTTEVAHPSGKSSSGALPLRESADVERAITEAATLAAERRDDGLPDEDLESLEWQVNGFDAGEALAG